jgi:hypothetical protein
MNAIQSHVQVALEYSFQHKVTRPNSKFFSEASGVSWQQSATPSLELDYEKLTLQAVSQFSAHLENLLADTGLTLDQMAGVVIVEEYPQVFAAITRLLEQAPPPRIEKHDLNKGPGPNSQLCGTVIVMHQNLSPEFLAYYLVDHDYAYSYMQDLRSVHKKDRKIRVASLHHVSTKPIWLQFGDKVNTYLYLSHKVSAAEEKWLFIVNYVMKLLVDFVIARLIRDSPGQVAPADKLLRIRRYGCYPG